MDCHCKGHQSQGWRRFEKVTIANYVSKKFGKARCLGNLTTGRSDFCKAGSLSDRVIIYPNETQSKQKKKKMMNFKLRNIFPWAFGVVSHHNLSLILADWLLIPVPKKPGVFRIVAVSSATLC